jgi:hypothetical protein
MSQQITAEELKLRRRPKIKLEIAEGEFLTLTVRPISRLEMAKLFQESRGMFTDIAANPNLPNPLQTDEMKLDQVIAGNSYIAAVCVAGVIDPPLSLEPNADNLTPFDLEPLGSADKNADEMPNVTALFRKIMEVSGYSEMFRAAVPDAGQPTETEVSEAAEAGSPIAGQPSPEVSHRPLDSVEVELSTV